MKTNTSDYALTTILSIVNEENKVHLVVFHSHTFTTAEFNYNTYDKELLAIFETLKIVILPKESSLFHQHYYGL